MSATEADSETDDEGRISLEEAVERSSPAQAEAFEKIDDALDDAPDSYSAEVVYESHHGISYVHISSSECCWKEGELGIHRFRIVIGPQGGLQQAEVRDTFCGFETDTTEAGLGIGYAWRRILEYIRESE